MDSRPLQFKDSVRTDVSLTPAEEKALKELYASSAERCRKTLVSLYVEIGGSAQSAEALSTQSLLNELRDKALPGEYVAAVRMISKQRAGLVPNDGQRGASAIERAMRVFVDEDLRVVAELTQLLGARRAEQLLNHADTDHSNHTFGVGPEKPAQ